MSKTDCINCGKDLYCLISFIYDEIECPQCHALYEPELNYSYDNDDEQFIEWELIPLNN